MPYDSNHDLVAVLLPRGNAEFLLDRLQRLANRSRARADSVRRPLIQSEARTEVALLEDLIRTVRSGILPQA